MCTCLTACSLTPSSASCPRRCGPSRHPTLPTRSTHWQRAACQRGRGAIATDCNDNKNNLGGGSLASGEGADQYLCPLFLRGTMSLNAAFFFTVLLSNVPSFAFMLLLVTLFTIYPASRHNIAGRYPNLILGLLCLIMMVVLTAATWLLLPSLFERCLFAAVQSTVLLFSPLLMPSGQRTCTWNWLRPSIGTTAKAKGSRRSTRATASATTTMPPALRLDDGVVLDRVTRAWALVWALLAP